MSWLGWCQGFRALGLCGVGSPAATARSVDALVFACWLPLGSMTAFTDEYDCYYCDYTTTTSNAATATMIIMTSLLPNMCLNGSHKIEQKQARHHGWLHVRL